MVRELYQRLLELLQDQEELIQELFQVRTELRCIDVKRVRGERPQKAAALRAKVKQPRVSDFENGRLDSMRNDELLRLLEVYAAWESM